MEIVKKVPVHVGNHEIPNKWANNSLDILVNILFLLFLSHLVTMLKLTTLPTTENISGNGSKKKKSVKG